MKTMQEMAAFKTDEKSDMQEQNTVNCNNSLQCKNIENTLTLQNERLELIIKKLEEDTRKANENRKEAMNALQSAYDGQKNETASPELLAEIERLQRENKKLNEENQTIMTLKKQNEILKQQIEEYEQSEGATQVIAAKDSLIEAYKKENQYLKNLLIANHIHFDTTKTQSLESSFSVVPPGRRGVSFAARHAGPLIPLDIMAGVNTGDQDSITESLKKEKSDSDSFTQPVKGNRNHFSENLENKQEKQVKNTDYENFSSSISSNESRAASDETNNTVQKYSANNTEVHQSRVTKESTMNDNTEFTPKIELLTRENSQLQEEIKKLTHNLIEIQTQLNKEKLDAEEYKKLMVMNQRAFQEISEEYNQLKNTPRDSQETDELQQKIEVLNKDNSEKDSMIREIKTQMNELQLELSKQKQSLEGQEDEMKSKYLDYEREATKQIRDLQTENQNLKDLLEKLDGKREIGVSTNTHSDGKNISDLNELFQILVVENKDLKSVLNKMCNILETKLNEIQANKTTKINTRIETCKNKTRQSCSVKNQAGNETKKCANKCTEPVIMKIPSCSRKCDTRWPSIFPIFISSIEEV